MSDVVVDDVTVHKQSKVITISFSFFYEKICTHSFADLDGLVGY